MREFALAHSTHSVLSCRSGELFTVKMQPLKAHITRALPVGCKIETCDNSGAKIIRVFTVVGLKTVKGRIGSCGVGDLVQASVLTGRPDIRKQVV